MLDTTEFLEKWRAICKSHTKTYGKTDFCECENCELKKYCTPRPKNINEQMIHEVVEVINECEVEI